MKFMNNWGRVGLVIGFFVGFLVSTACDPKKAGIDVGISPEKIMGLFVLFGLATGTLIGVCIRKRQSSPPPTENGSTPS
jgi:hypothetical protein